MATSFAPPAIVLENGGHDHGHGYGHGQSQGRKSSVKRIPLQPTTTNGGLQVNGEYALPNPLKPRIHHRPLAIAPSVNFEATSHDQSESNLSSSLPQHPAIDSNDRPKGMERRRSSVGLPTHLRLGSSGYGFPPTSSQKYQSVSGRVARKWATRTEAVSAVIVPLPYILASLAFKGFNLPQSVLQYPTVGQLGSSFLKAVFNRKIKHMTIDDTFLSACYLTSMTLILVGLRGKVGGTSKVLDRRKHSTKSDSESSFGARKILERIISVGLPYFATMKLGGDRVALLMLLALHADITHAEDEITDLLSIKGWKRLLAHRPWTLVSILLQICCDLIGLTNYSSAWNTCLGYLAIAVSILYISPPFPSLKSKASATTSFSSISASPTPRVFATQWETRNSVKPVSDALVATSPLFCTKRDTNLTIAAGSALGALTCIISYFSRDNVSVSSVVEVSFGFLSACTAAISFQWVQPHSLRQNSGFGLLFGSLTYLVLLASLRSDTWESIAYQGAFIGISFVATKLDSHLTLATSHSKHLDHHHPHPLHQHAKHKGMPSRFSEFLLRLFRNWPLLHSILAEKDSRRIFYFMSLNFAFMLIQLFYGIATGSLGLLSDSIHMFFDCLALVVGLCAAVMSKWPPSTRFPYGYGKMDTLAGFANGIFLMLISIEIVYEAIERLAEGSEMQRIGELLTVSSLGLVVNLIGITAFGHAHHGHSHGGHDHSHGGHDHSHGNHDHSHGGHNHSHEGHDHSHGGHDHSGHSDHAHPDHTHDSLLSRHDHHHHDCDGHSHSTLKPYLSMPAAAVPSNPTQAHTHSHKHHHGNENMHGIFLHILADTLGSVAVVISTLLIHFYGWSGFDPLASCLIAILIFASAIPLVTSSARTLLLTIPEDTEFDLREALAGVSGLRGVVGYAVPKFWLDEGDERKVLGVIHVIASKGADMEDVKERAVTFLRERQMEVIVQVERDGSDRCWCRGGAKA